MKTDRTASYSSLSRASVKKIEKRKWKESKKITEPVCSAVVQSQKIFDILHDGSCNSDLKVGQINDLCNKRSHKCVVKNKCITVFFLKTIG